MKMSVTTMPDAVPSSASQSSCRATRKQSGAGCCSLSMTLTVVFPETVVRMLSGRPGSPGRKVTLPYLACTESVSISETDFMRLVPSRCDRVERRATVASGGAPPQMLRLNRRKVHGLRYWPGKAAIAAVHRPGFRGDRALCAGGQAVAPWQVRDAIPGGRGVPGSSPPSSLLDLRGARRSADRPRPGLSGCVTGNGATLAGPPLPLLAGLFGGHALNMESFR